MIIMLLLNIILWILIVIFALMFFIAILPINLEFCYENGKIDFKLKLWILRIDNLGKLFSKKEDKSSERDSEKVKSGKKLKEIQNAAKYIKVIVSNSGKIMKMIIKSIVFKKLNLKIFIGSEEASKTATTYGTVCAVVYPVASAFIACNEPKNYNISVTPNFILERIKIFADLKLETRVINLLIVAVKTLRIINSKL